MSESSSENEKNFFSKVETTEEMFKIYAKVAERSLPVTVQLKGRKGLQFVGDEFESGMFTLIKNNKVEVFDNEEAIFMFDLGVDKYFLKAKIKTLGKDKVIVDVKPALFKLQRRESFRISIPEGYPAKIHITDVDGLKSDKKLFLFDLSGGGAGIEIPPTDDFLLAAGQTIKGKILVNKNEHPISGTIRHIREIGEEGKKFKKIGFQFDEMTEKQQQALFRSVMEIHRDVFSRLD
ncbi:MAG: PilZ domain-containing protein [Bdellovibrionales bacterium]|nr:PilZ domain-containing protein [Bdellovibrionales bacterium]